MWCSVIGEYEENPIQRFVSCGLVVVSEVVRKVGVNVLHSSCSFEDALATCGAASRLVGIPTKGVLAPGH
jgi:hypothetical protein